MGADQETATLVFGLEVLALTPVGEPGTSKVVRESDAPDALDVPVAFVAVTVKVYAVPLVRPVMVHEVLPELQVLPPGVDVAV
jgi:hypothetical protein